MPAAYQDEDGKWFKQCSTTKKLFGPVDNKEDLSEWFHKDKTKSDGLNSSCKEYSNSIQKQYREKNLDKVKEIERKSRENNKDKIKQKNKRYRENNSDKVREIGRAHV